MLFLGKDCSHSLSLPLKEKGKSLSLTISQSTSLYFLISQSSTKLFKCKASASPSPKNYSFKTRCRGGTCNNRSANKVIVVVTSEVTQLSVFSGTRSNSSKQEQS